MRLTLRLQSYCGQPPDNKQEKSYESFPVFIGRSTSCDFVLDDISKYISSNHATVLEEQNQLQIQDTSSNGVYINGSTESIGRGKTVALAHGDTLTIGDYSLTVGVTSATNAADPFDEFSAPEKSTPAEDPFDPFQGQEQDWTPESQKSIGDDFWDSDDIETPGPQPGASEPQQDADADDWADWPAADNPPPPSSPKPSPPQPRPVPNTPPADLDWLPGSAGETISAPRPIEDSGAVPIAAAPPTQAYANSPQMRARSAPPSRMAEGSSGHGTSVDTLLRSAGLDPRDFANADADTIMETAGLLLNQSLDGLIVLLQSRTELKNAIRTDVTRLDRENNNPLKFSTGPEDAMMKLLAPNTQRGFLPADVAMNQAIDDLKAHHLAMLEGMKAAVRSMLVKFDPDKLEQKLEKANPIAANIPITREAKLWQLFHEKFSDIREEAVNDFNEMFGNEFRKAYDRRIKELDRKPDF